MKKKNKINEGALDVGIQSYPMKSKDGENKTTSQSTSKTTVKSTSGFKKNARVYTNPQNLKKTLDTLKDKEVDVVVTDGMEDKVPSKLEYVSEVIDEGTGEISKPFTIGGKNYQMVRAMGPDKSVVMGVYAFDEMDESGNCKIYEVNEFEKIAINELGVQEPEGPEAATLNPLPEEINQTEKPKEKTKTTEKPSFEGYKHFIVNEKLGKVRKFKTIQELAKAQMMPEETYMGIKEFKKYIDSALFGRRKMKEAETTEVIPSNVTSSVEKTMSLIGTKLTSSILEKIKQNPVAQEQMILAFAKQIGVPANRLTQLINGIKGLAQEVKQQNPATSQGVTQQTTTQVSERRIIKVKDLK